MTRASSNVMVVLHKEQLYNLKTMEAMCTQHHPVLSLTVPGQIRDSQKLASYSSLYWAQAQTIFLNLFSPHGGMTPTWMNLRTLNSWKQLPNCFLFCWRPQVCLNTYIYLKTLNPCLKYYLECCAVVVTHGFGGKYLSSRTSPWKAKAAEALRVLLYSIRAL